MPGKGRPGSHDADSFLRPIVRRDASRFIPAESQDRLMEVADAFLSPALVEADDARISLLRDQVFPLLHRESDTVDLSGIQGAPRLIDDDDTVSPGMQHVLAAMYLRATEILDHPEHRDAVLAELRSGERLDEIVRAGAGRLEDDFFPNLARNAVRHSKEARSFRDQLSAAAGSIASLRDGRLHELAVSGHGRINSPWQVSVVLICPLAWWLCAVAAVAFIIIFIWIWVS